MSDYKIPRINRMQFGTIDEKFVNRATQLANDFADVQPQLNRLALDFKKNAKKSILVKLGKSKMIKEVEIQLAADDEGDKTLVKVAWSYRWQRVKVANKDTIIPMGEEEAAAAGGDAPAGHPEVEGINSDEVEEVFGEEAGMAYNIAEMAHGELAPIIFGIDMSTSTYPAGFRPKPIDEGSYVYITRNQCFEDNYIFYSFDRLGVHDGSCVALLDEDEEDE